jgi:hypothetical protein
MSGTYHIVLIIRVDNILLTTLVLLRGASRALSLLVLNEFVNRALTVGVLLFLIFIFIVKVINIWRIRREAIAGHRRPCVKGGTDCPLTLLETLNITNGQGTIGVKAPIGLTVLANAFEFLKRNKVSKAALM